MIVSGERVAAFVSARLGFGLCPPYVAIGIERDGQICAGVLVNHFEGADCHVTAAGKGWAKGFLQAFGEYVFGQLGCLRFTIVSEQPDVIRLAVKLGGEIEGRLRDHFGQGRTATVVGVLADDYRFGYSTAEPSATEHL